MRMLTGMRALLAGAPAWAAGPDQAALDDAVRLGATATLAPLCGVRDELWAFDLRRAAILRATRTDRPHDEALRKAPGSASVQGALGYAEAEALEDFAGEAPARTCTALEGGAELGRADAIVEEFRALKAVSPPGS